MGKPTNRYKSRATQVRGLTQQFLASLPKDWASRPGFRKAVHRLARDAALIGTDGERGWALYQVRGSGPGARAAADAICAKSCLDVFRSPPVDPLG